MDLMKRINALEARVLTLDHNCSNMERLCENYEKKIKILELELQFIKKDVTIQFDSLEKERNDQLLNKVLIKVGQLLDGKTINKLIREQPIKVDKNISEISQTMEGEMVADNLEDNNLLVSSRVTHKNDANSNEASHFQYGEMQSEVLVDSLEVKIMRPVGLLETDLCEFNNLRPEVSEINACDTTKSDSEFNVSPCKEISGQSSHSTCNVEKMNLRKRQSSQYKILAKQKCENLKEKFKCHHCKKEFQKRDFILHIQSHGTELYSNAQYVCKLCGKQYLRMDGLQRHKKMNHKVHQNR